jgi:hypothetical protein
MGKKLHERLVHQDLDTGERQDTGDHVGLYFGVNSEINVWESD